MKINRADGDLIIKDNPTTFQIFNPFFVLALKLKSAIYIEDYFFTFRRGNSPIMN